MRTLVTGAAGFIGSRVVRSLVGDGERPLALVRPGTSTQLEGADILPADLHDAAALARALESDRPDVAIHLAWRIAPDVFDSPANQDDLAGTLALVRTLVERGCRRHVFAGTYLEHTPRRAAGRAKTASAYTRAKHALHEEAARILEGRGTMAWVRIHNVYGPGAHAFGLVATLVRKLRAGEPCELRAGGARHDWLHVDDAARGLVAIARSRIEGDVELGSGHVASVSEVATLLGELTGRAELVHITPGGNEHEPTVDAERLAREAGFVPRITLAAGLAALVT